jgi:hypothetical protein
MTPHHQDPGCCDYAAGLVDGKWDLIRTQCTTCHVTTMLSASRHGACSDCGVGFYCKSCYKEHRAVAHNTSSSGGGAGTRGGSASRKKKGG